MRCSPSSFTFVVHTALGIPGKSELTTSSTSRPCLSTRNVLRAPRPHAAKIWGVSEFGNRFMTFASKIGQSDSISSTMVRLSKGRGRKYAKGRGVEGSAMPKEGYEADENSGSLSSSPSFWNWYK